MFNTHVQRTLCFLPLLVTLASPFLFGGCASSSGPTQGWSVMLRVSEAQTSKLAYYQLTDKGKLAFTGGLRAANEEPSEDRAGFVATYSAGELAPVVELLKANPEPEKVQPEEGKVNYRVMIHAPGQFGRTGMVTGPTPFTTRLEVLLRDLINARRKPAIEALNPR